MKFALCILVILGCASAQFSSLYKQKILNSHNILRSEIAMGNMHVSGAFKQNATNMREMKWDNSLEKSAQDRADNCSNFEQSQLGESIFIGLSATNTTSLNYFGERATELWEEDLKGLNSIKMDEDAFKIKEATQMIWADTDSVGCGGKLCPPTDSSKFRYVVVCHYKEPGNKKDVNIYEEGTTCSNCPEKFGCDNGTGLCVLKLLA